MKLNLEQKTHTFMFNGEEITVKEFLTTQEKITIIATAIESAFKFGSIPSKLAYEATLGALMCFQYSDIEVENLANESILTAYDIFSSTGFISALLSEVNDKEYNTLIKYADRAYEDAIKYYNSGANVLETAIKIGMSTQLNKNDS